MTDRKNKFGFGPVDTPAPAARSRTTGPMGAAVREAAEDLRVSTDAKIAQRKQNSEDARVLRKAKSEGRLIEMVALEDVHTTSLPRDRLDLTGVASSDAMDELKASIRVRGQKEPIEVWRDGEGRLQLKKGWRRLTALRQLLDETGEAEFASVLARIDESGDERLDRYVDMVEENVVREDLSFAEMAAIVLEAANDPEVPGSDVGTLVNRLYGSLHKTKRSYIRAFVHLLTVLGDDLPFPKSISRNLGVEVSRKLQSEEMSASERRLLSGAPDPDRQRQVLEQYLAAQPLEGRQKRPGTKSTRDSKVTVRVGDAKVVARYGECRIVMDADFAAVPQERLEEALRQFNEVIGQGVVTRG